MALTRQYVCLFVVESVFFVYWRFAVKKNGLHSGVESVAPCCFFGLRFVRGSWLVVCIAGGWCAFLLTTFFDSMWQHLAECRILMIKSCAACSFVLSSQRQWQIIKKIDYGVRMTKSLQGYYQSMWSQRSGKISCSSLSSIYGVPPTAPFSSRSTWFFESRSPLRSAQVGFQPVPRYQTFAFAYLPTGGPKNKPL